VRRASNASNVECGVSIEPPRGTERMDDGQIC
jgi:hypothetical protein